MRSVLWSASVALAAVATVSSTGAGGSDAGGRSAQLDPSLPDGLSGHDSTDDATGSHPNMHMAATQRENAIRFRAALLKGWERANPAPKLGDTVAPGTGYHGAPLPPGTTGTVTAEATPVTSPSCWNVAWSIPAGSAQQPTPSDSDSDSNPDSSNSPDAPPPTTGTYCYGNGVYELAVLTQVPGMPAVDGVERVPTIDWTPSPLDAFAEFAAAADTPLIFRETAVTKWKAAAAWQDLDSLLENVTMLPGVKVNHRGAPAFKYYHRAPMNTIDSLVADYRATTFTKHDMPAAEFLRRVQAPRSGGGGGVEAGGDDVLATDDEEGPAPINGGPVPAHTPAMQYAWAGKVEDWGLLRLSEVLPLDPLMVLGPSFDPAAEHLYRETRVWLSPSGTTTPTHYDISHNMLVQVKGRKRVVLFPPVSWQTLYPFPLLHPGGLSAQTSLHVDPAADPTAFPAFRRGNLLAYVAEIGPGEVLYIPPMWWHSVTALDETAVSVSVWSPYEGSELYTKAVESTPLPIKSNWAVPRKTAALRLLIESLIRSLQMDGIDAAGATLVLPPCLPLAAPR
jgi:hypothetical protein